MGTSSKFGGQSGVTPLVPKWLLDPEDNIEEQEENNQEEDQNQEEEYPLESDENSTDKNKKEDPDNIKTNELPNKEDPNIVLPDSKFPINNTSSLESVASVPIITDPYKNTKRFQSSRKQFNGYLKSRNKKRIAKAIKAYVKKGTKGSKNATRKMGKAPKSVARLSFLFNSFIHNGIDKTLKSLNFNSLIGKPFIEVLIGIYDYICPNTGNIPDSIISDAYSETIISAVEMGITELDRENLPNLLTIFISKTIEGRILNDIGNKTIDFSSVDSLENATSDVFGYVEGCVSDCIDDLSNLGANVSEKEISNIVKNIYTSAFELMKNWEENINEQS